METVVYQGYSNELDMTTIFEDVYNGNELVQTSVKGFYYGEPNEAAMRQYYGSLKATY